MKMRGFAADEDGAVKTLTFSDEIVLPASMPDFISPHIATWGRYDWEKCREDEGLRQHSCARHSNTQNAAGFISSAATGICLTRSRPRITKEPSLRKAV